MIACQQKYCKNCIKPKFNNNGEFLFGRCKIGCKLVLFSDERGEANKEIEVQPLYCYSYEPRKRRVKY